MKNFNEKKWQLLLFGGIILMFLSPWLFTRPAMFKWLDFSTYGTIGDTIGGLTSPIINTLGAVLVYLSFKEQREANKLQWKALEDEKERTLTDKKLELIMNFFQTEIKGKVHLGNGKPISHSLDIIISHLRSLKENEGDTSYYINILKQNSTRFAAYISLFNYCIEQLIQLKIDSSLKLFVINLMIEEYDTHLNNLENINLSFEEFEGLPPSEINSDFYLAEKLFKYFPDLYNDLKRLQSNCFMIKHF